MRWNRAGSRHQVFLKSSIASKLASALAPGGHHSTSSKLNSSLASTAKSLFFCGRARKRKSGFSVPTTGGSKIHRVGGMWGDISATKLGASKSRTTCSELIHLNSNLAQTQSFSYPTRTRFLLEARINRLE